MGLPYSKQINAAFSQVTPLVASSYQTLDTIKNISLLLAAIQVLTVILLFSILLTLFAILITLSPDLDDARQVLVLPVLNFFVRFILKAVELLSGTVLWIGGTILVGVLIGGLWGLWFVRRDRTLMEETEGREGEDIEAIKRGESDQ